MKNIIVCIKQVPDTDKVQINRETNTLIREGVPSIINPFDENALEAALQLKEKFGARVIVVSMGPPQVKDALRQAVAMGADEVVLASDRSFAGADTWATSYTLAQAIKEIENYDLIICGKQAIDGDTAQVGPGIAEFLDIPQITFAQEIGYEENRLKVKRVIENGYEEIETELPAVVTVTKEINEPRYPSLKGKMKAKSAEITVWDTEDLEADENKTGLNGSPTKVVKIFTPPVKASNEIFTGDPSETAAKLAGKLKELKI
ncbi:MAG: electron transfer flavoprotein subunit beta/FixA family protein [bacterium]|nr:electron transfer flavoprotein subunit beta/FixA family protein [bacterium]